MKRTFTLAMAVILAFSSFVAPAPEVFAAEISTSHDFAPVEWNFGGEPVPETYWTPWLPLGSQQLTRFKFGVRASMGAIAVRCPVKVTFTYDPAKVKSGGDVPVKIKVDMIEPPGDTKTFESAFGISLPNKLQLGFFGITGMPDLLPWIDIPYNLWEAIGKIPKYGSYIESAVQNIGVNTSSDEALPLGSVKSYHDERTLFSFDLSDLAGKYKNDIAISMYNKLSDTLGPYGMGELLTMIQLTKNISSDAARDWLTDLCGSAVEKLGGFTSIELMGDPSFSVEGIGVRLNFRAYVTGGKGSGDYVMTFNRSGQEQTFTFRDITPFIEDGDKLVMIVDSIGYDFKLKQKLVARIKIAIVPVPIDSVEKTVSWTCPTRAFTASDFKVEIPVSKSTDIIQSLRVNPGYTAAAVNWTSPQVPLKGKVIVYNANNTKVKEVSESTFKNAHNVVITDLQPATNYRFAVECLNTSGEKLSAGELTATTKDNVSSYQERLADTQLTITDTGTVTAGTDYIDFTWTTDNDSSTEVIISPSPELHAASVPVVKKTDGTIQGWVTRGGTRIYEKNHSIRAIDLEPGTKYYFLKRSFVFQDNDDTKTNTQTVGCLGNVTTQSLPETPSIKIKVQFSSNPLAQIPVLVKKTGDASFRLVVNTGQDGFTPQINLDKGGQYTFSVENNLYFDNITSSAVNISQTATGEQSSVTLSLVAKPSPGAYVYNAAGQPLSGATVKIVGNTSYTATTDAAGLYKFSTLPPITGGIQLEVSKTEYTTKRINGRIDSVSGLKIFSADKANLQSSIVTINITVKQPSGAALSNVLVKVENGGTELASLNTNPQGKATFTYNFGENSIYHYNLKITAEKTANSLKIAPNNTITNITSGITQDIDISCLVDNSAPVISNVSITQASNNIEASFTASEQGQFSVDMKNPSGQTTTTIPWSTMYNTLTTRVVVAGTSDGIGNGGIFKFKIKYRDAAGNETQTEWLDIEFVTAASWNLKANVINNSTVDLSWKKFPRPAYFTRYEILKAPLLTSIGGTLVGTITDINTTTYRLTNLQSSTTQRYIVKVPDGGTPVGAVNFTTGSQPPVISNFTVTPNTIELNGDVTISANITDTDTALKEYKLLLVTGKTEQQLKQQNVTAMTATVSHTLKATKAGSHKLKLTATDESATVEQEIPLTVLSSERPVLKFVKTPAGFIVNKASSISLDLTNKTKVSGDLEFSINWGDGASQTVKANIQKGKVQIDKSDSEEAQAKGSATEVEHTYATAADFTITVNATLTTEEKAALTNAESLTAAVTVTALPTEVSLVEDKTKGTDNQKFFNIKATGASYKVTSWSITYGDGTQESGTGDVDKQVSHNYRTKNDYVIELTVTDSGNNEIKKLASVRIRSNAPLGGTSQSDASQLQQVNSSTTTTSSSRTSTTTTSQTQQQETKQTDANQAEIKEKVVPLKVTIKTISLDDEEKSTVPAGKPLKVNVEIESTADIAGPITANVNLKIKTETQEFNQEIKNLKQGSNTFEWSLVNKLQAGQYTLSIEIINEEPAFKAKKTKTFKVVEQ